MSRLSSTRHASFLLMVVAGLAFAGAAILATKSVAFSQGAVRAVYNDWQIRCDTPPGTQHEQCVLFQSVVAEDRANVTLTVLVVRTADQKMRLMRVVAP